MMLPYLLHAGSANQHSYGMQHRTSDVFKRTIEANAVMEYVCD